MQWHRLIFVGLCLFSTQLSADNVSDTVVKLWGNLNNTQNQCPEAYDYYPNGGLRTFYCHLKTHTHLAALEKLAGISAFIEGPHGDTPNFDARYEFGHYNPAFVQWLVDNFIPANQDPEFKKQSEPMFYSFAASLAQTYYVTYLKLHEDKHFFRKALTDYKQKMTEKTLPEFYANEYYEFADLHKASKYSFDGNVVKHALLFWLRRHIDGTDKIFLKGLTVLLDTYAPYFIDDAKCTLLKQNDKMRQSCAEFYYMQANQTLNEAYADLRKKLAPEQQNILEKAQLAWQLFRDLNAEFSVAANSLTENQAIAVLKTKQALTETRIIELSEFAYGSVR